LLLTDDSGQVLGLPPSRARHSAAAATSADQQQLPLSHGRPKLIGKARPATNGIRTSTKYSTKIAEQAGKVNFASMQRTRWMYLFFGASFALTLKTSLFKLQAL
jgi:hypothetical protein